MRPTRTLVTAAGTLNCWRVPSPEISTEPLVPSSLGTPVGVIGPQGEPNLVAVDEQHALGFSRSFRPHNHHGVGLDQSSRGGLVEAWCCRRRRNTQFGELCQVACHRCLIAAGESGEVCGTCGALCWRDENGRIEEYDNQPPQPVWDAAIWED